MLRRVYSFRCRRATDSYSDRIYVELFGKVSYIPRIIDSFIFAEITLVFGKSDYKGKQKEIVEAAVRGVDVFVSAPTGMGKVCDLLPCRFSL